MAALWQRFEELKPHHFTFTRENLPPYFDFITDAQRDGYDGPGITKVTPPVQWGPHGKGHQCRPPLCKRKYNDF